MTNHNHLMLCAALLLATAVAGAAARGSARAPFGAPGDGKTTFAAPPNGPVRFTGRLDRTAVLRGQDGVVRMELTIAADATDRPRGVRRPTDLVIVLDRSGSMAGEKIERARAATTELIRSLGGEDRFGLVTYSNDAAVALPLTVVDERSRAAWTAAVAEIHPDGGTNMSSGLDVGLEMIDQSRTASRVPRLILISDGLANQGDSSPEGLTRRASRAAHGEYMLSTVGVGADFNEYLMSALADAGTGNYYYLRDAGDLAEVFAREFDAARTTVASALTVAIEPGSGVRVVDAAGYPLERTGTRTVFRPGALFAGQNRRVWVTLEVPRHEVGEHDLGRFSVSYGEGARRATLAFAEVPRVACVESEERFYSSVDLDAWGRSVVVDAYNKMQQEVAREVKAGRKDEAIGKLHQFRDLTKTMNARLQSPEVAAQLGSADRLEASVAAAFEGDRQHEKQNELSKTTNAGAVDARRVGSKK
ncbi:MAG: vWA domain-containing protein [Candidatus Binatia bacterium]